MKNIYISKTEQLKAEERENKKIRIIFKLSFVFIFLLVIGVIVLASSVFFGWGFKEPDNIKTTVTELTKNNASDPLMFNDFVYEIIKNEDEDGDIIKSVRLLKYKGTDDIVVVPSVIDKLNVDVIANSCFAENNKMASVTIPTSVINIENYAFYKCNNLRIIQFAENSVYARLTIGNSAFADCRELITVYFPHNELHIGNAAFQYCTKLQEVEFNTQGTLTIGMCAFQKCRIKNIELPKRTRQIDSYAFKNCSELSAFTVPASCETGKDITKVDRRSYTYQKTTNKKTTEKTTEPDDITEDTTVDESTTKPDDTTKTTQRQGGLIGLLRRIF